MARIAFYAYLAPPNGGALSAKRVPLAGTTTNALLRSAERQCPGSFYVDTIVALAGGKEVAIYRQKEGWLLAVPTSEAQLRELRR